MRNYIFGESQYYQSSDCSYRSNTPEDLERRVGSMVRYFTKRRLFRELLGLYGLRNRLSGYVLLEAHGVLDREEWMFFDGKRRYAMQNWIYGVDGQALAILLLCCDPHKYSICSEHSILIHPRDPIDIFDLIRGDHLKIYVPEYGYLDEGYRLKKSIESIDKMRLGGE